MHLGGDAEPDDGAGDARRRGVRDVRPGHDLQPGDGRRQRIDRRLPLHPDRSEADLGPRAGLERVPPGSAQGGPPRHLLPDPAVPGGRGQGARFGQSRQGVELLRCPAQPVGHLRQHHLARRVGARTHHPPPDARRVVMQIHYNLLAGTAPDRSQVRITTVPAAGSALQELRATKYAAPPDLPCPAGVTGPLCDRQASIADLVARTGTQAEVLLDAVETVCAPSHDPLHPQMTGALVTTTCSWPVHTAMHILGSTPHMHLLGQSETISLVSGSTTTVLAHVAHYNFDGQVSYRAPAGTWARAGDTVQVTCCL